MPKSTPIISRLSPPISLLPTRSSFTSHWTAASDLRVIVFSNCEEIELLLNDVPVSRQKPAKAWMTQYLPHAPFVFDLPAFAAGSLEARGFIAGSRVATHRVRTPDAPAQIGLEIETMDITAAPDDADVLIAHASILDARNTLCVGDTSLVAFAVEGGAEIVGPSSLAAEAGIASIVLRVPSHCRSFKLSATRTDAEGRFFANTTWQYRPSGASVKGTIKPTDKASVVTH